MLYAVCRMLYYGDNSASLMRLWNGKFPHLRSGNSHRMSRKFIRIYLALAPVIFGLSWFISHRLYLRFMRLASGDMEHPGDDRSIIYASAFTVFYLSFLLIINDLYRKRPPEGN